MRYLIHTSNLNDEILNKLFKLDIKGIYSSYKREDIEIIDICKLNNMTVVTSDIVLIVMATLNSLNYEDIDSIEEIIENKNNLIYLLT